MVPSRLFVALPLPPDVRRELEAALRASATAFPQLRWTAPEGRHITLAFLGEVPPQRHEEVVTALEHALVGTPTPRRLALSGPGHFNRRVLWVGVDDHPEGSLAQLGAALQTRLAAMALPVTHRAVHAHVTLARTRDGPIPTDLVETLGVALPRPSWEPSTVEVWSSVPGRGAASYRSLVARSLHPGS